MIKRSLFGLLIVLSSLCFGQKDLTDSLLYRLSVPIENDSIKVKLLNDLAVMLMFINPDTCILLSSEALELAETGNDKSGQAISLDNIGMFQAMKSKYDSARSYFKQALEINLVLNNKYDLASNYSHLGNVCRLQGDFPNALEYYIEAMKIGEEMNNKAHIAINLVNIASIQHFLGNSSTALTDLFKAAEIFKTIDQTGNIATTYVNIGSVYAEISDFEEALCYYLKAEEIFEKLGNKRGISTNLGNVADAYLQLREYDKSLKNGTRGLEIALEINDKYGASLKKGNIGAVLIRIGEYQQAESILLEAIDESMELGALPLLKDLNQFMSDLYDSIKQPAKALAFYKLHIKYRDSISNEENTKSLTRSEITYNYEKKEIIEQQAKASKEREMLENTKRRDNLQYSIILISLLIVFGGVLSLGVINVSPKVAEGLIFFAFLILFEFVLVLADPYVDQYSKGAPGYKLLFNAVLAGFIFPLHAFFEKVLKKRLILIKRKQ